MVGIVNKLKKRKVVHFPFIKLSFESIIMGRACSAGSCDGLLHIIGSESELSTYLKHYRVGDIDGPVVSGRGFTIVKKYGRFTDEAIRFLDSLK